MSRVEEFGSKHFKELGCFEPVTIRQKDTGLLIDVPCGHCLPCLERRRSQWVTRLVEHLRQYPDSSYFVTLTYSDEELPIDPVFGVCVSKDHIKKLNRDLRKRFQQGFFYYENSSDLGLVRERIDLPKDQPFRYYITSEYSPALRPHYHAVYYNLPKDRFLVSLLFETIWKRGIVRCFPASPESIGYITKYLVNSKISEGYDPEEMIRPFSMMSKNLGISYIERMKDYHLDDPLNRYSMTSYHGEHSVMPRYYRDKIFPECFRLQMFERFQRVRSRIQDRIDNAFKTPEEYREYEMAYQRYKENRYYAAQQVALKKQSLK